MNGEKLSELINVDEIKEGVLNLIEAPCGSGKTYFAKTLKSLSPYDNMLYLIDTSLGKEQLIKESQELVTRWCQLGYYQANVTEGITFMTYAGFAKYCDENYAGRNRWLDDAVIICDELQNAVKWSKWSNGGENNPHRRALDLIRERIVRKGNIIIAISATPDEIRETFASAIHNVPLHGEAFYYETEHTKRYSNLTLLLRSIPKGQRGIVYIQRIEEIKKYMEVLKERGFAVSAIWSKSNQKHPLSEEQQGIRRHIIEHREIPPDIDVLFINASCETCINIGNAEKTEYPIDFMIIHNSQSDVQTQVRGRYRNDLKTLYLYEPTEEIHKEQLTIPRKYLGIRLSREDIRRLISYLNLRDEKRELITPTAFKRLLKEAEYKVKKERTNKKRFIVITK